MAYDGTKLALLSQTIPGTDSFRLWVYRSTDAASVIRVTGYITDATARGMKLGDLVLAIDTDASPIAQQWFQINQIFANGSADLSDGIAITATDTD